MPILLNILKGDDVYLRRRSALAIGNIGSQVNRQKAVTALLKMLREDKNPLTCFLISSAFAVGKLGVESDIAELIEILSSKDSWNCAWTMKVLGDCKSEAVISALLKAAQHENRVIRHSVALLLDKIDNKNTIKTLERLLSDESPEIQVQAGNTLKNIGNEAAIKALERALEHENPLIVQSSANFIVSAKGKEVIPTLLTHKNGYVRSGAVLGLNGLKNIKPQSRINILSAALTDEWVSVRDLAAKTLQEIGSTDATDALVEALKHHDSVIRYSIAEALRQLLSDAGIEALERILADQDLDYAIRVTTASALNFATINPQILSILNTVFHEDKNPNVCIQVISTLKETRDAEQLLPRFSELRLRISEIQATGMLGEMAMANDVLDAIATIQSRCKFYNYEFEEERKAVIIQTEGERSTNQPVTNNYTAEVIQFIEKNKGTIIGKSDHKAE